jgi:lysophospholipase L1-like esterase
MKNHRCGFSLSGMLIVAAVILNQACPAKDFNYEPKPTNSYFAKFNPRLAPAPGPLLLKTGDKLAIIGDSITEQRRYSRIIETYLTVCVPELKITARQFGWSGETAEGFLHRMTNDCLRFEPTVATLCYGMNDHHYRPFDEENAKWYAEKYSGIVKGLQSVGARVVLGAPGCVGKVPGWTHSSVYTMDELNINLCALRDIDIDLAADSHAAFADVFWNMFKAEYEAQQRYGTESDPYMISGKDGVHPGWAGHLVMAYSFLRAMGLDGDIGTLTVDLGAQSAIGTDGHMVEGFKDNTLSVVSTKYPFCVSGETNSDDSLLSATTLIPFFEQLDRFRLIVKNATAPNYKIVWGNTSHTYTAAQLAEGVNLAADFIENPFTDAFKKVDEAVAAKQAYETKQIKEIFHGQEGKADMAKAVETTEATRAPIANAIAVAMVPVRYNISIQPVQ